MMKTFRLISLGLAFLAAWFFPNPATAQTSWTNSADGSWLTPGNWSAGVPTNTDTEIGAGGNTAVTVTLTGAGTSGNLYLGRNFNSTPTLLLTGNASLSTVGAVQLGNTSSVPASGTVTLQDNATWTIASQAFIGFNNASGTVNIQGNSIVTSQFTNAFSSPSFSVGRGNNNTGTGNLNVSGNGQLIVNQQNGLVIGDNLGRGAMTLSGNGSVTAGGNVIVGYDLGSTGEVFLNGGVLTAGNVVRNYPANGSVTFNGGTLRLSGDQGALFNLFEVGNVVLTGAGGTIDTQGFDVATSNVATSGAFTVPLALTGDGSLTKQGSGTLTLRGANTYTGGTTVSAGDLRLTGSLAAGTVNVSSGGIFSGTGSAVGAVIVANGGAITPGNNGAGTLTVGGLTLNSTSVLNYQLGTSSDRLQINGNLTLDGTLNVAALGGFGGGTYRLMDYTGTLTNNGLNFGVLPGGYDLTLDTATANQVNLISVLATSQFWDGANTTPNGTVDGGTGTWNAANTNWTNTGGNANSSWLGTLKAVFAGTAGTVTIENGYTATAPALDFNVSGYTLAAAGTGNLSITGSTDFNTVTGTTTISAPITGSGNLSKVGTGTLVLSGANTYSGGTTISNGILQIGDGGTTGSITGNVTNNASLVFNRSNALSYGGDISGSGTVTQVGSGTTTLTGTNTYTGGTTVRSGTLAVTGTGSISHSSANMTVGLDSGDNATLAIGTNSTVSNAIGFIGENTGSTGAVTVNGGNWTNSAQLRVGYSGNGTLTLNNGTVSNSVGSIGVNAGSTGTVTVNGGNWTNTADLYIGNSGNGTLTLNDGTVSNGFGYIGGFAGSTGTVTVNGGNWMNQGELTVGLGNGTNGTLTLNDGTVSSTSVRIGRNTGSTGTVTVNGGNWTNTSFLEVGRSGNGTVTLNNGTVSFFTVSVGSLGTGIGSMNLNGGTLITSQLSEGSGTGTVTFKGGTLRLTGNQASLFSGFEAGDVVLDSGGGTIDTQNFDVETSLALGGVGKLTKQGSGTLTLSGTNSYTGGTTVSAGDLRLTGSLAGGTVTVQSGGSLLGTGTVAGTVVIEDGGAITPGDSGAGTLTVGGLVLNNTSILNYQLGTSSDRIQINGDLTLDGTLNVAALSGFGVGTYRLMDYTGTLTNSGLTFGIMPGGYDLILDTATASEVNLISILSTSQFWDGSNTTPNDVVDGGTGTWNATNTNWTNTGGNANSSWLGTLKAVFAGTAGTVTIENGYTATAPALDFNVSGYTLVAAGTGSLSLSGTTDFNTVTGTTTISAPITGGGSLSKVGAGTLVLSGTNTYSGGTTLSNGILQIGDGGTTGSITGNVTNNASLVFNRSDALSFGGDISGSGTLTQLGAGTTTLTGTNTYTGGTTVRAGILAVGSGGSISHSAADLTVGLNSGDNATLQIGTGASIANDNTYLGYNGGSSGTAQISGGSWTHTHELYVGYTGNGTLEISGGIVSDTKAFIGVNSPSVSSATVSGGQWNNSGELTVGYGGTGSLAISGTGEVNSAGAYLGFLAASDGNSATVAGADASWNSTGTFYLGYDGSNNSVTVSAGALLAGGNADVLIGSNAGSDGNKLTVTGSGSRFTDNGTLYVGRSGTGNQLEVLDGAVVTSKNVRIGGGSGSVGTTTDNSATVDGTDSTWNIFGTLRVGSNGDNTTLTVKNGGAVNVTGNSFVGYDAVSDNNLVKVTGAGSTLAVNALSIGRLGTNNTVSVESGGKLTATTITVAEQTGSSGSLLIGNGTGSGEVQASNVVEGLGNGTVTFDGGTLKLTGNQASLFTGFEDGDVTLVNAGGTVDTNGFAVETALGLAGNGRLTKQGSGTLTLSGTNNYTGGTTVRNGTLAVTGTVSHALADLTVGQSAGDNATLQLSGTGSVSNSNGFIGYDAGSTGLAQVGAGSWTNNGILYVGLSGDGTLELSGSGSISDTAGYIGYSSGSTGLATVSGGSWTHSGGFAVGFSGDGTLELSGTGSVSNADGYIGYNSGSTGLAQVSGGSWTNSGALYVGVLGDGTLELSGTGSVSNTSGYIGYLSGSTGLATVSGGSWTHSGGLAVGFSGDGTLELSGTGSVSNADGYISYNSGSAGLAQVSGGSWTNSGALYVGVYGDGTLELSGTGSVSNTIGYIGYDSISTSMVTVSGGSWTNSAVLAVGFSGDGTLGISGTGSVSNTIGYIGYNSGSTGLAQVTGGTWTHSAEFVVGYAGDGTLELSGTGSISDTVGYIGYFSGSTGLAQVSGGSWTHSAGLAVGFSGDGTLELSGTGSVSNTDGYIGYNSGSTGLAQVSGGSWTNSGALNVGLSGDGTLELSGTGSVSAGSVRVADQTGSVGAVKLLGGTLATGQVSKGSGSGTVTFNGGTLKLSGNQASLFSGFSDGDVNLTGPGGGTIDTQAFAVTTALGLAGNGPLTKTGSGSLNLTGSHTYTGATNVNNGSLFVNGSLGNTAVTVANGGLLGGSGSIAGGVTVQSGGILAPGNSPGILTLGSLTLDAGSVTRMQINGLAAGTEYDRLVVTNNANLNGTLALEFGFTPAVGDRFTLIQAGSYTLSGDAANGFALITTTGLGATLKTTVEIDPTNFDILIDLRQADFAPFAGTPNQNAVAGALDEISRTGTIQDLIDYLNTLPAGDLHKAFEQLSPEELALLANTGFANTRGVFNMLQNRIQEIKNGQQFSGNGLTLWDDSRKFQQSLLASAGSGLVPGTEIYQPAAKDDKRMGFFVSGQGVFGDVDGDGNGDAYDFTTGGMIVGADYRLTPNTAVGLYAGYQGSTSKTSAASEIKSDSAKVGAYGSWWHEKGSWLSANIGGGVHSYDTERVSVGGLAKGSSNGTEINGQLAVGHEFKAGAWTFGPEADLAYTRIWIDGFTESGSLAPLAIGDQEADSMRSTAAFKVSYDWRIEKMTLRPYGRIGWQHEFMDDNQAITARFAGGGGSVFTVQSPEVGRDSIVAGAGLQALFSETISAWLGYNAEANADYEIHQINGSLNFRF